MNRSGHRRRNVFRPLAELVEGRLLLSTIPNVTPFKLATDPAGFQPIRPNTPVLPYGVANKKATFVDTTAQITNGRHIFIGVQTYVGPYSTLNAKSGFIKIGNGSFIGDNAQIYSDPFSRQKNPTTSILIGDNVLISYGAKVVGPSVIGGYINNGRATEIGPNAEIDGAVVGPGAIVGALARVGPGVTVPGGMMVLPGANVTTDAQASDPALGMVTPVPSAMLADLGRALANSKLLAAGYSALYQGQSATGVSPGVATATAAAGPFNGNLAAVEGANLEPGTSNLPITTRAVTLPGLDPGFTVVETGPSFEPATPTGPTFEAPRGFQAQGLLTNFKARVTGEAAFHSPPKQVEGHIGRANSIAADQGQPINLGFISQTGNNVTINAPTGSTTTGALNIGRFFQAGTHAVLLGGGTANYVLGDQVSLGAGSVVFRSSLGTGTTVGPRAYVANSTLPANSVVPAGAIIINNRSMGTVQW